MQPGSREVHLPTVAAKTLAKTAWLPASSGSPHTRRRRRSWTEKQSAKDERRSNDDQLHGRTASRHQLGESGSSRPRRAKTLHQASSPICETQCRMVHVRRIAQIFELYLGLSRQTMPCEEAADVARIVRFHPTPPPGPLPAPHARARARPYPTDAALLIGPSSASRRSQRSSASSGRKRSGACASMCISL